MCDVESRRTTLRSRLFPPIPDKRLTTMLGFDHMIFLEDVPNCVLDEI